MANRHPLFDEFRPATKDDWKAKIEKDLKGTGPGALVTRLDEGFDVQPFYMRSDLDGLEFLQTAPGAFPFLRGKEPQNNRWLVNQDIVAGSPEKTRDALRRAAEAGADSLTLVLDGNPLPAPDVLDQWFKEVEVDKVALHFRGELSARFFSHLAAWAQTRFGSPEKLRGSVENDPVRKLNLQGLFAGKEAFDQLAENFRASSAFPLLRTVTVDGTVFHNAGGTTVSEMAYTLAVGSEYLEQLTARGITPDEVAPKMVFRLATGSDYFMEIAKFRAFRYLWAQILHAYGATGENAAFIMAENSFRNKTVYDPYVNMLRTTTETMSAILGGADAVTVLPFDAAFETPSEMARRIARNQQLILKEESYFDKVADPAAGSYYIENLTAGLIEKSWELFLETDDLGGYTGAFEKGAVRQRIEREAARKDAGIASGKISVLGVNRFPNIREKQNPGLDPAVFETEKPQGHKGLRPLHIYRAAAPFEKLRFATDRYAETHPRPRVWLLPLGDLARRRARAQFAENFFGCAGYEIVDHSGFASAEEGIAAARKEKPEIVVLCADDKTYENAALPVFEALKNDSVVVLAGNPEPLAGQLKAAGMEHFIHVRSNRLEKLQEFNKILGIK